MTRDRFDAALERQARLAASMLRLGSDTRDAIHRAKNTRHAVNLFRQLWQERLRLAL